MNALLYLSLLLAWLPRPEHDFHVSKCLIDHRPEQQALQISLHIFLDDLELALEQRGHSQLRLCTPREAEQAETIMLEYLREHFQLRVNGQERAFRFVGKEVSDDLAAVWCYLEITDVPELQSLELTYRILFGTYADQKNIASLSVPGRKRGMMLFQAGQGRQAVTF